MRLQVNFQILIDIVNDRNLLQGLVLPSSFKDILSAEVKQIKLLDTNKLIYYVGIEDCHGDRMKIRFGQWPYFVNSCIRSDTTKLCFRLAQTDTFEVFCFDIKSLQIVKDVEGKDLINRYLVKVNYETLHTEYTPPLFLDDLNGKWKLGPDKRAHVFGPLHNESVEVVYEYKEGNITYFIQSDGDKQMIEIKDLEEKYIVWHAIGFTGTEWRNFSYKNHVKVGYTIMLTNARNCVYLFDVFNCEGVGLGVSNINSYFRYHYIIPHPIDYKDPEEEDIEILSHDCRVPGHDHDILQPYFFKQLTYRCLTSNKLIVPIFFVMRHNLNTYTRGYVVCGDLKLNTTMEIFVDNSKNDLRDTVVIVTDWKKIVDECGISDDSTIRSQ